MTHNNLRLFFYRLKNFVSLLLFAHNIRAYKALISCNERTEYTSMQKSQ